MQVRQAILDDMLDILRLGRQFCEALGENFDRHSVVEHVDMLLEMSNAEVLLVEDEGYVVGMAAALHLPLYIDSSQKVASELWWWVDPEYRNAGAGSALLDGLESWARSEGCTRMSMMLMEELPGSRGVESMYYVSGYKAHERTFVKEL